MRKLLRFSTWGPGWYSDCFTLGEKGHRERIHDCLWQKRSLRQQVYSRPPWLLRLVWKCQLHLQRILSLGERQRLQLYEHWCLLRGWVLPRNWLRVWLGSHWDREVQPRPIFRGLQSLQVLHEHYLRGLELRDKEFECKIERDGKRRVKFSMFFLRFQAARHHKNQAGQ